MIEDVLWGNVEKMYEMAVLENQAMMKYEEIEEGH